MTLGADFAVLPFILVVVASLRIGLSVTGLGAGMGEGGVEFFYDTVPTDNVVTARSQTLLFGGRFCHLVVVRLGVPYCARRAPRLTSAVRWSTHLRGEPHHKQHTEVRTRSTAGCGRSVGSVCTAGGFSGRCSLHRDPQNAELGQGTHFRHFLSPRNQHNNVLGEGGGLWRPPGRDGSSGALGLPGHGCPDYPAHPAHRLRACVFLGL
jgi:hypothetical protein